MIDFTKAFDSINHAVLLSKLDKLNLPPNVKNWIISFLSDMTQMCKVNGVLSALCRDLGLALVCYPGE